MGKRLEGAIKGALAAAPISLGYGAAGNPGGGLLAIGMGAGIGATIAAAKEAPSEAELQGRHPALNNKQNWSGKK